MEKVLIVCEESIPELYLDLISIMKEYFESCGWQAEIFYIETGMSESACQRKFSEADWKYICTLDMAGFQLGTVLGVPRYNIMYAKQIHIVINEETFMLWRQEEFALNLYLFMPDTMRNRFTDHDNLSIPNLFFYKPFESGECRDSNREELLRMIETVRRDCEIQSE